MSKLKTFKQKKQAPTPQAKCAKCGADVDADGNFCFGCRHHICDNCGEAPFGKHKLADHHPACDTCGERVEDEDETICSHCRGDE